MREEQPSAFGKAVRHAAHGLVFVLVAAMMLFSVWRMAVNTGWNFIFLGGAVVTAGGCYLLARLMEKGRFGWIAVLLLAAAARTAVLLMWNIPPISDFDIAHKSAVSFWNMPRDAWRAQEDTVFFSKIWPNLMPWVLYEALIVRLFGASVLAQQISNVFWSAMTCLFICRAGEHMTGSRRAGLMAGFLQAFNCFNLVTVSVLTCQHIATALLAAGLCVLFRPARARHQWLQWVCGGVVIALSHLMRTEMAVVLIGIALFGLYRLVVTAVDQGTWREKGRRMGSLLLSFALFFGTFFGVVEIANQIVLGIGATERPITSPYLKYKVMVGLNADTNAGWSQADADLFVKQVENPDEDLLSKAIGRRWRQKDRLPGLMFYKAEAYIGNYFDYFSTLTETEEQANFTWNDLPGLCRASILAISVLTLIGAVKGMLDRRNEKLLLTGILLAGYVLAYLLIEVQTRYAQVLMPMMTMLAGYGGCVWKSSAVRKGKKKDKASQQAA